MATVAASTEKLAELKAEEAQATAEVAPPAGTTEEAPAAEAAAPSEDAAMTDEEKKDKVLRAVRQSMSPLAAP